MMELSTAKAQKEFVEEYARTTKAKVKNIPGVETVQKLSNIDRAVRGPVWISRVSIPAPKERDLEKSLWDIVQKARTADQTLDRPSYTTEIPAEWTGFRADAIDEKTPEPLINETEKYKRLPMDCKSNLTILYIQGGGYIYDKTAARPAVKKLCQETKAKAFTISYRLAPQHTLPAQLLDLLVGYFYLSSPPSDADHHPIPASSIVLCADSAGCTLGFGLIQTLLQLQRQNKSSLRFYDSQVQIELPAGFIGLSPTGDVTRSLPSMQRFASTDWLGYNTPWGELGAPADATWPTNPPRGCLFCEVSALDHPFISPCAFSDWSGAPPIFLIVGDEINTDSVRCIAQTAARQGVSVRLEQYEYMPHSFAITLPNLPQSRRAMHQWSVACLSLVNDCPREMWNTEAVYIRLGDLTVEKMDINYLTSMTHEELLARMKAKKQSEEHIKWTADERYKLVQVSAKL